MKKISLIISSFLIFAIATPAFAAEFIAPNKDGNGEVVVSASETHRNLYIAGGNLTINGTTNGDLYAAGGSITVDGPVQSDANIAGGNVHIAGKIGGDLRATAGTLNINSQISGDALVGGGSITFSDKSAISGDLVVGGGSITLNAPVNGSIKIGGGTVNINSKVRGDVWIRSDQAVTFGPLAEVPGKIKIYSNVDPQIKEGAKVSEPQIEALAKASHNKKGLAAIISAWFLIKILALFIVSYALSRMYGRRMLQGVKNMQSKFWTALGTGVAAMIIGPIAFIILLLTGVGYYAGIIEITLYILAFMLSCALGAAFIGSWVLMKLNKKTELVLNWQAIAIGTLIMSLVPLIPIVGWIITFGITLASFGVIVNKIWNSIERKENN